MRVLLVAGTYPPRHCGIGDYVARLARALVKQGDQVAVLTMNGAAATAIPGVDVLPGLVSWRLCNWAVALGAITGWQPDVVHIHYPAQDFGRHLLPNLLPLACKWRGLKVIQTWHESWHWLAAPRFLLQRMAADALVFVRPDYPRLLPPVLRALLGRYVSQTIPSAGALPVSRLSPAERLALRQCYLQGKQRLVVFFGFLYPAKGAEQLFEIAQPQTDAVVFAGPAGDPAYLGVLAAAAHKHGWDGQVRHTGFLDEEAAADLLAAADAVVLPFLGGGGDWNTSIHGALAQGTLVITTSTEPRGDDPARNLYTAAINDVASMRQALQALAGRRSAPTQVEDAWERIALEHRAGYRRALQQ